MGNLGSYQTMVILAKKVGGPRRLAIIIAAAGGLLLRGAEEGGKAVWRRAKVREESKVVGLQKYPEQFTVTTDVDCGSGPTLHAGDKIHVLERAGDAVLLEIIGDDHNPHVISIDTLTQISDFRGNSSL